MSHQDTPLGGTNRQRFVRAGAVPLAYLALAVLMTWPYAAVPGAISFLGYDSLVFLWNFWWVKFSLCDLGQSPLFCDYLYWPGGTSLAMHPLLLPYGLVSIPLQLGLGDLEGCIAAQRLVTLASPALSAWLMYLLARRLVGHGGAAFCAGLVFAFPPFRILHMQILHVYCWEFIVLWALVFLRLWDKPTLARGVVLGSCAALLTYASQEYALYGALFALFYVGYRLARKEGRAEAEALGRPLALAVLIAGVLVWPLLWPILTGHTGTWAVQELQERTLQKSPSVLAFFVPSVTHPVWGAWMIPVYERLWPPEASAGMRPEASLGYAALSLALVGALRGPRGAVAFWRLAALAFLILSLGPRLQVTGATDSGIPLPYALLGEVAPIFRMNRDPLRMAPLTMLAMGVLAAYGVRHLACGQGRLARCLPAAFCALVMVEYLCIPCPVGRFPVPAVCQRLREDKEAGVVLDVTPVMKKRLYFQIVHQKKLIDLPTTLVPRASEGIFDLADRNPSIKLLRQPQRFLSLPPDQQRRRIEENRGLLSGARAYVVVHLREQVLKGNYWDGVELQSMSVDPASATALDRVLALHQPVAIIRTHDAVAYRF